MVVTKRPRWAETPSSARASAPSTSPRNSASPDSVAAKPRRTPRAQRSRRDTGPHASHAGDQATSFDVAVFSLVSAICCSTSRAYTSSASFGLSVSLSVGSCSHCGAGQPCRCAAAHAAGRRSPAAGCRPSPAKSFPANGHFGLRRRKPRCQGRRRLIVHSIGRLGIPGAYHRHCGKHPHRRPAVERRPQHRFGLVRVASGAMPLGDEQQQQRLARNVAVQPCALLPAAAAPPPVALGQGRTRPAADGRALEPDAP